MYNTFKVLPEYKQSILAHFKKPVKLYLGLNVHLVLVDLILTP